jgi:N-acetylmuramoyl-L-alanine amidase
VFICILTGLFAWLLQQSPVHAQKGNGTSDSNPRWEEKLPPADYAIPPYARFLAGLRIVIDPGHGGDGFIPGYKQGPSGVREAEVNLRVPGVLTEASFFSHPPEEQRLNQPEYNRREAFGIFLGLARWAAKGLPYAVLQEPDAMVTDCSPSFLFYLNDGLEDRKAWGYERNYILADSIAVRLDGVPVEVHYDPDHKAVRYEQDSSLSTGGHTLRVEFQNAYKHHNVHPEFHFTALSPGLLDGHVICIDPGHGGTRATDPSRLATETGVHEEETNLKVALLLEDYLTRAGADVVLTRKTNEALGLYERVQIARDAGAEVFVSIHHNGCFDPSIDTPQVFFHGKASSNKESVRLARRLRAEFERLLGRSSGAVISDKVIYDIGFAVLRHSMGHMTAVLGEPVYFTNRNGARQLADDAFLQAEARAYLNAIVGFFQESPETESDSPSTEIEEDWTEQDAPFFERILDDPPSPQVWREHLTLGQEWLYQARECRKSAVDSEGNIIDSPDARIVDEYYRGALQHFEMALRYFPNSPRAASLWEDIAAVYDEMLVEEHQDQKARTARLHLVQYYPDSAQAARARQKLLEGAE